MRRVQNCMVDKLSSSCKIFISWYMKIMNILPCDLFSTLCYWNTKYRLVTYNYKYKQNKNIRKDLAVFCWFYYARYLVFSKSSFKSARSLTFAERLAIIKIFGDAHLIFCLEGALNSAMFSLHKLKSNEQKALIDNA